MAALLRTRAIKTHEQGRLEVPSVVAASSSSPRGGGEGGLSLLDGATDGKRRVPFVDLINERSCMCVCVI